VIVCERFPGDTNGELMNVQHDVYGWALGQLFESARAVYLHSARVIGIDTPLTQSLETSDGRFDHRVLQEAHDLLAARFRRMRPDLQQPDLEPGEHGQRLRQEWCRYLSKEATRLAEQPLICRAIVKAVVYQNTQAGYRAEEELAVCLRLGDEPLSGS